MNNQLDRTTKEFILTRINTIQANIFQADGRLTPTQARDFYLDRLLQIKQELKSIIEDQPKK